MPGILIPEKKSQTIGKPGYYTHTLERLLWPPADNREELSHRQQMELEAPGGPAHGTYRGQTSVKLAVCWGGQLTPWSEPGSRPDRRWGAAKSGTWPLLPDLLLGS